MKKTTISLIVLLYAMQVYFACLMFIEELSAVLSFVIPVFEIVILTLMATNAILALINKDKEDDSVFKFTMICKCCLIPYHIMNFVFCIFLALGGILLFLLAVFIFFIIIMQVVLSYFVVLSTSIHNVVQIDKQKYKFGKNGYVLYTILSLFFVTDVVASILVYQKMKEYRLKQSIALEGK